MVDANKRADNFIVRIFKGIGRPEYRQEQRVLLRADVLARNASFQASLNKALLQHLVPAYRGATLEGLASTAVRDLVKGEVERKGYDKVNF